MRDHTKRIEAALEIACKYGAALEIACKYGKDAELADLRNWKESAMEVFAKIDLQAIGKEIGVRLGHDISPAILPWIVKVKAELAEKERELDEAVELLKDLGQQQMDDYKRHKAEVDLYKQRDEVWRGKKEMLENDLAKAFDCLKRISDRCLFNHKCDDCGIVFCVFRIAREGLRGANPGEIRDVVKQLALYRKAVEPVKAVLERVAAIIKGTDTEHVVVNHPEHPQKGLLELVNETIKAARILGEAGMNDSPKATESVMEGG